MCEKSKYNLVSTLAPSFFDPIFFILAGKEDNYYISDEFKIGPIRLRTAELAALERLEKFPESFNGRNVVNTLVHSFLTGSSSLLQVIRVTINTWMS